MRETHTQCLHLPVPGYTHDTGCSDNDHRAPALAQLPSTSAPAPAPAPASPPEEPVLPVLANDSPAQPRTVSPLDSHATAGTSRGVPRAYAVGPLNKNDTWRLRAFSVGSCFLVGAVPAGADGVTDDAAVGAAAAVAAAAADGAGDTTWCG